MQTVEQFIHARWVIPVVPKNTFIEHGTVVLEGGKIIDVGPADDIKQRYHAKKEETFPHHALCPGFINAHSHAAMVLLRGYADDLSLMEWLNNHIWPAEKKLLGNEFVYEGTRHAIAEMLKGGTTCFNDMYFFGGATAQAAKEAHIRVNVGLSILEFPTPWANDLNDYIQKAYDVAHNTPKTALTGFTVCPHAPYTVSDEGFTESLRLAEELQIPLQVHLHETKTEVDNSYAEINCRPIQRLYNLGILSENTQCVHMTQLTEDEIQLIAQTHAHVVHCPESNLKLASGFCAVNTLLQAGVNVALGTDGAASNNDLSMLGEMQTAALIAKVVANDATALDAYTALEMATINGAKALGLSDKIGSLEKGKEADMVAINLKTLNSQPCYHPVSQIIYAATDANVTDVWVAGKRVVKGQELLTLDEAHILHCAQNWANKLI